MMQRAPKAPVFHFPFRRLAICLDCDACFELGPGTCPACGSETLAPLARFFQPNGASSVGAKLRRHLFVVARDHPEVFEYLKRAFAGSETLHVVLDRRVSDRRRQRLARLPERRRGDRRRQDLDGQLRALGWAVVLLDIARDQERERAGRRASTR